MIKSNMPFLSLSFSLFFIIPLKAMDAEKAEKKMPRLTQATALQDEAFCHKLNKTVHQYKNHWERIWLQMKKFRQNSLTISGLKKVYDDLKDKDPSNISLRKKFTLQEDSIIFEGVDKHGFNWIKIAESLPERHPTSLKNRYYSLLAQNSRSSKKKPFSLPLSTRIDSHALEKFIQKSESGINFNLKNYFPEINNSLN
jgi:hypothetical protein